MSWNHAVGHAVVVLPILAGSTAEAVLIASTGFEHESPAQGDFIDLATDGTAAGDQSTDIMNQAAPLVIVDSTSSSATAGDLGFDARWQDTLPPPEAHGFSEGDAVGITNETDGSTGGAPPNYAEGTQGYTVADSDGRFHLSFDAVNITPYDGVTASFSLFVSSAGFGSEDEIVVTITTDAGLFTALDTTGFNIDDLAIITEDAWRTYTTPIFGNTATLEFFFQSNSNNERFFVDDIRFEGNLQAEASPEPGSLILLASLFAVSLARRRRAWHTFNGIVEPPRDSI